MFYHIQITIIMLISQNPYSLMLLYHPAPYNCRYQMCVLMEASATVLPSVIAPWCTLVLGVRSVNVNHMERVREMYASVILVLQVIIKYIDFLGHFPSCLVVYNLKAAGPLEFKLVAPMPEQIKTIAMQNKLLGEICAS